MNFVKANFFSVNYKNRVFGLDIMRFLSIFYVVYAHAYEIIGKHINDRAYNSIFLVDDAVTIFFVLSGFLIGKILIEIYWKEGLNTDNLKRFWARRWFRTLPNYYLIVFGLLLVNLVEYHSRGGFSLRHLVFLQNFNSKILSFFPESWSLATEEWFYLLLPISILVASYFIDNKQVVLLVSIISFIILPLALRLYKASFITDFNPSTYGFFSRAVVARLDSTMYGVLGAYFKFFYSDKWKKYKFHFIAFAIAFHYLIRLPFEQYPYCFFAHTVAFSSEPFEVLLFLPLMDSIRTGRGVFYKIISFISIISYSMYVLNLSVVLRIIFPFIEKHSTLLHYNDFFNYALYWALTIVLSYLLYILYERPMMNLRDKVR